jgi:hypothetical protein
MLQGCAVWARLRDGPACLGNGRDERYVCDVEVLNRGLLFAPGVRRIKFEVGKMVGSDIAGRSRDSAQTAVTRYVASPFEN